MKHRTTKRHRISNSARTWLGAIVALSLGMALPAAAQTPTNDQTESARLRGTTASLVKALLAQGLITRERADELLRTVAAPAAAPAPAPAPAPPAAVAVAPAALPAPPAPPPVPPAALVAPTAPIAPAPAPRSAPVAEAAQTGLRVAPERAPAPAAREAPRELPRAMAQAAPAPAPTPAPPPTPAAAPASTEPQWGAGAPTRVAQNGVVRVPYISESLRAQIKEEIRNEVFATAREENWADARKVPDWVSRINIDGDLRVRGQAERFGQDNLPASEYRSQVESPAWSPDLVNAQTGRQRMTLRARLGITAKITDDVGAGLRLSTGNTGNGPTSSSATLGNGFNKLQASFDRAWLRWEPRHDLRIDAGRMPSPFFGTDLLWPDDLSLDGVALRYERTLASGVGAFVTAGVFPLEELALSGDDKWLYGLQVGVDWALGDKTQLRLGVGVYDFKDVEGVRETTPPPSGALAGTTDYQLTQYPASIRSRGNTLINLNDPTSTAAPVWGLASKFRPLNITAGVTFTQFAPMNIGFTLDYVKNSGFDLADITRRAGTSATSDLADKTTGIQARAQFGALRLAQRGDWNAFIAARHFERDAWVDAYTDTTWHLGGTNYKGYALGANYAIDRNTWAGMRWTSTRNLDDGKRFLAIPGDPTSLSGNLSSAPLKIEVLQLELNTRF